MGVWGTQQLSKRKSLSGSFTYRRALPAGLPLLWSKSTHSEPGGFPLGLKPPSLLLGIYIRAPITKSHQEITHLFGGFLGTNCPKVSWAFHRSPRIRDFYGTLLKSVYPENRHIGVYGIHSLIHSSVHTSIYFPLNLQTHRMNHSLLSAYGKAVSP